MRKICFVFAGFFMPCLANATIDVDAHMYGTPPMYGEYEITADDVKRASKFYGDIPASAPRPIAAPARPGGVNANAPIAKQPVRTKTSHRAARPAVKKNAVKKSVANVASRPVAPVNNTTSAAPQNNTPKQLVVPFRLGRPANAVAPRAATPQPNIHAANIANNAGRVDADEYCTSRGVTSETAPDGYVLMPGRPDLMSCRDKK